MGDLSMDQDVKRQVLQAELESLEPGQVTTTLEGEAGGGNRTRMASLEGWSSTIELHPHRTPPKPSLTCSDGRACRPAAFRVPARLRGLGRPTSGSRRPDR